MYMKNVLYIGAAAFAAYLLLRNSGKGTSVMSENGKVDTKLGFDGTRAKNLVPDIYGRGYGRDVYSLFAGAGDPFWGLKNMRNMSGLNTINICKACQESVKQNNYKVEVPKIL